MTNNNDAEGLCVGGGSLRNEEDKISWLSFGDSK